MQNHAMNLTETDRQQATPYILALIIILITFVAYFPCMKGPFIWDDNHMVYNNPLIKGGVSDGLMKFWFTKQNFDYFPLTFTSLWIEWRLWGTNPMGYRLVNILLHALCAIAVWRILKRLKVPAPWLIGAIFAVHPVAVGSVAWIAERKNTLSMVFFLLSLLSYLRFEDEESEGKQSGRWYWLSLAAFLAALFSKTSVVMLPVVILGLAWWRRGKITRKDLTRMAPYFAAAFLMGLLALWFQYNRAIGRGMGTIRPEGPFSRTAAAGWSLWWYAFKAIVPVNLMVVPPRWHVVALNPVAWLPLALYAAVAWVCWKNRATWGRHPLAAMGYHAVNLLPVLGIFQIYFMRFSLVGDHWHYIAYIGPVILLVAPLAAWVGRQRDEIRLYSHAGAGFLLCLLCVLTWRQSSLYANERELWLHNIRHNREGWVAYHNAAVLFPRGSQESLDFFSEAINLNPEYHEAYFGRGQTYSARGQLQKAAEDFNKAVSIRDDYFLAQNELGLVYLRAGAISNAIPCFRKAIKTRPNMLDARINLAGSLMVMGSTNEANAEIAEAMRFGASDVLVFQNLGTIQMAMRQRDNAVKSFKEAIQRGTGRADPEAARQVANAYYNLGLLYLEEQKIQDAYDSFSAATVLNDKFADARMQKADLMLAFGYPQEAASEYIQIVALNPDNPIVRLKLGNALFSSGNLQEAATQFEMITRLRPDIPEAYINLGATLAALNNTNAALECFRTVLAQSPNNIGALAKRATVLVEFGRIREAEADYRQVNLLDPANVDALNGLARIYALHPDEKARDPAKAVEYAERASLLTKGNVTAIEETLATAYFQAGNTNKAFEVVDRTITLAESRSLTNVVQAMNVLKKIFENTILAAATNNPALDAGTNAAPAAATTNSVTAKPAQATQAIPATDTPPLPPDKSFAVTTNQNASGTDRKSDDKSRKSRGRQRAKESKDE